MKLNIAIVDDLLSDSLRLKSFIQGYFHNSEHDLNNLISYSSGEELLKDFEPEKFHVVFMDIIMNKINGVQTARQLRIDDSRLLIIFMTTSREYALEAFTVHPFDYILKPYNKRNIDNVLDEAVKFLMADDPSVTIKISQSDYQIPMSLVSSIVSQGHNVEINLTDGRSMLSNMAFKEIKKLFDDDPRFLLCNRGIIVNMSQISSRENGVFIMKNGMRFPIRVRDSSKIAAAFSQFLITHLRGGVHENFYSLHDRNCYHYP